MHEHKHTQIDTIIHRITSNLLFPALLCVTLSMCMSESINTKGGGVCHEIAANSFAVLEIVLEILIVKSKEKVKASQIKQEEQQSSKSSIEINK